MDERSFDEFDEFANNYRNIHTQNIKLSGADSFYFAEMKVRLLENFEQNKTLRVLDVGCGDGLTEFYMQQYFPAWKMTGIDISSASIDEANKRNLGNASFTVYNGQHIPFEDDSFDLIFMAGVLHHVAFHLHDGLIKEVYRVLKNSARFYLFEHNPLNPFTKYLVKTCVFDKHAKLLSNQYTSSLLKKHSFTVTDNRFIIFFPRKGLLSKLIFIEKYLQWLPLGGQYFIKAVKR
jgi:ubiquinone/menaquinone biosynthesis C-methylase UbiE